MEENVFIESVFEQLKKMSVKQKDAWILAKAKLLSESDQQGFLMSLSGEKIITYMPTGTEIEAFCERVLNGEIYVEYERHYYEFDSEGRYVDGWYVHHNDPQDAFAFLNRVFRGCHDLVRLGEYQLAGKILDKVCRLEFRVVEAEASEEPGDDYDVPFTIADAKKEGMLPENAREIGYDWIEALLLGEENKDSLDFAEKLVDILNLELCRSIQFGHFYGYLSEQLVNSIEKILEERTEKIDIELEKISDKYGCWRKAYELKKKMARNKELLLDFRKNCTKESKQKEKKKSVLGACWEQICEQFKSLSYEAYIDDQPQIDEVWNICEALIRRDRFAEEEWKLRKTILKSMADNEYYDCYGCYDPIKMLAEKLYITKQETLEFADILNQYEYFSRAAADLYRQYGRRDKYMEYLEKHLNKSSNEYVELIQCHCEDGNEEKARLVAEQGMEKCKDDLTEIFRFLLQDAKKRGDTERYKKFYASAKRRRNVNLTRIEEAL